MAPKEDIPPAATVLGLIGTILWCIELIPQIWTNWRSKNTKGLRCGMLICWALCGPPFGVCAFVQNFNVPLKLQANIFMALDLIVWGQVMFYGGRMTALNACLSSLALGITFGAFETVLVLTLKGPYQSGITYPITIVGVMATILLTAGFIFPYIELLKPFRHGHVLGLNFLFLGSDFAGSFFSLIALVFQSNFSVLGGMFYIMCMALEAGLFLSQLIWVWRYKSERKEARELGINFEELMRRRTNSDSSTIVESCTEEEKHEEPRYTTKDMAQAHSLVL